MNRNTVINTFVTIFGDKLAGPYLLGYIIIGLGLMTLSGPLMILGTVMIACVLLATMYVAFTE